jgi:DNA topoisomerase-1
MRYPDDRSVAGDRDTLQRAPDRSRADRRARTAAAGADRAGARAAGLRFRTDDRPGIRRARAGRGFVYRAPGGRVIRDPDELRRIRALVIPPAWTEVWISPEPDVHLLATGRDARGRKVYRYHPRFRAVQERRKFERLIDFGRRLPSIRRRVRRDLARRTLTRDSVSAAVIRLLELTLIRVGNDEYARANRSFGLTTLRDHHVEVDGALVRFHFRGKARRQQDVEFRDRRLAGVIQRSRELPGRELLQYVDETGRRRRIRSADVNGYLRDAAGSDVTAKDFRTWFATVLAYRALRSAGQPRSDRDATRRIKQALDGVADHLGNTTTVARASYVHPAVVEAYVDEELPGAPNSSTGGPDLAPASGSRRDELAVLRLLARRSSLLPRAMAASAETQAQ